MIITHIHFTFLQHFFSLFVNERINKNPIRPNYARDTATLINLIILGLMLDYVDTHKIIVHFFLANLHI